MLQFVEPLFKRLCAPIGYGKRFRGGFPNVFQTVFQCLPHTAGVRHIVEGVDPSAEVL